MELLQEILVFITFLGAVSYIFGKFVWTPAFLKSKKATNTKSCGKKGGGCC